MRRRRDKEPSGQELEPGLRAAARNAALQLGATANHAEAFSRGEEIPCDRWFLSWAAMPETASAMTDTTPAFLITLTLDGGREAIALEELKAMLALAPAFLAHKTAIGYDRIGQLCLYRLASLSEANTEPFVSAIRQLWTLSQSLWPAGRTTSAQGSGGN